MFTPQEFNQKVELKTVPPKGWVWVLLKGIVTKWLYENAESILKLLVEHLFGKTKAFQVLSQLGNPQAFTDLTPVGESPTCNKHDPNDPHFGEAGDYNNSTECVWIPEV